MRTETEILLNATAFAPAAKALFHYAKTKRKSLSLAFIGQRLDIKSRGHLSEIFAGKRPLHAGKVAALAEVLGLEGAEREYFTLLRADDAGDEQRLTLLRRVLTAHEPQAPAHLGEMFLAFKVFAAFSLFGDRPTRHQLVDFFGKANCQDIDRGLALLIENDLVVVKGQTYVAQADRVIFRDDGTGFSLRDYFATSLNDARDHLGRWLGRRDQALFQASIISVSREAFSRALPDVKARLREEQARLEDESGDMLVHFNVQIYPVEP